MSSAAISELSICRREAQDAFLRDLPADLHPVLRRVYAARRVSADQLNLSLSELIPVGELTGASAAAARLVEARKRGERVLSRGAVDAAGAPATALCVSCRHARGFPEGPWRD